MLVGFFIFIALLFLYYFHVDVKTARICFQRVKLNYRNKAPCINLQKLLNVM